MQNWAREFSLAPGARVNIDQGTGGKVEITAGDGPSITVTATTEGERPLDERIEVDADTSVLSLRATRGEQFFFGLFRTPEAPVHFQLRVPVGTPCEIEAGSGAVTVTGTRAPLVIETGSGHVVVTDVSSCEVEAGSGVVEVFRVQGAVALDCGSGSVLLRQVGGGAKVETGSGAVTVNQVAGGLRAKTGSGGLTVADVEGVVELEAGSGSITLSRIKGAMLVAETGSGRIRGESLAVDGLSLETGSGRVQLSLAAVSRSGDYRVETGSGSVEIALPADAGIDLNLQSDSGRIRHDGLNVVVTESGRGEVIGRLNDGGAHLRVETGSGTIALEPCSMAEAAATGQKE